MCVYLRSKFAVSRIILTSFRLGVILPKKSLPQNKPLKSPPGLGLNQIRRSSVSFNLPKRWGDNSKYELFNLSIKHKLRSFWQYFSKLLPTKKSTKKVTDASCTYLFQNLLLLRPNQLNLVSTRFVFFIIILTVQRIIVTKWFREVFISLLLLLVRKYTSIKSICLLNNTTKSGSGSTENLLILG